MPFDFKTVISLAPGFSPVVGARQTQPNGFFGLPEAAEAAEAACRTRITGLKLGANERKTRHNDFENTP